MISRPMLFILALTCARAAYAAETDAPFTPQSIEFFEKKIRPLLVESCFECHSAGGKKIKGDLRVDSRDALLRGGESGTSLIPGDPSRSRLIEAVTYRNADLQMPPKKKLSDVQIADLSEWVKMGAPWPAEAKNTTPTPDDKPAIDFEARKRNHWAWQPVKKHEPPSIKNTARIQNDIDRFILAKLEAQGLTLSAQGDPRTLIRRVTFDLTGLPPTPEEVEAFVKEWEKESSELRVPKSELKGEGHKTATISGQLENTSTRNSEPATRNYSSAAYSRLVDRLLASAHYGERWARHWLDIARYADSKDSRGQGNEVDIAFAYRYRDWVIDAFNRDLPYDQFIREQIAGDLLVNEGARKDASEHLNPKSEIRNPKSLRSPFAPLIATAFLTIGTWETGDSDKRKMMSDIVDDQIDVISRGFLGMTVACARCHDHKFDPISTRDYYALAGFFFSSHIIPMPGDPTAGTPMLRVPLMSEDQLASIDAAKTKAADLKKQINAQIDQRRIEVIHRELARVKQYLLAAAELHESEQRHEVSTLSAIAAKHGVHAAILKRFVRYLGMAGHGGTVRGMFTTKLTDILGNRLVTGWGSPDTPSIIAYSGGDAVKLSTFTLPPRSVAAHPSPTKHVAIGWRSKFAGTVSITGSAADADAACGNGIDWSIILQRGTITTRLAGGTTDNSGSQSFAQGDSGKQLAAVQVQPGDLISVIIDAKGKSHSCDTTTIDFVLSETGGAGRKWNLAKDVVDSILASNPHADSHGNREVWHFYAINTEAGDEPDAAVPQGSILAQWLARITEPKKTTTAIAPTASSLAELVTAVHQLATSGANPPANRSAADITLHRDLTSPNGPLWSTIDLLVYSEADTAPLTAMKAELAQANALAATRIEFVEAIREGGVPGSEHAGFHDAKVHLHGRYDRLGDVVPRGFPALITTKPQPIVVKGSGRLELANWIASPENPLTARVMMNRLWQHHFGRGIVPTPDNFGHLGEAPTHPELLDHLAVKFVESGWSIKAMHKLIVTSAAYMQASGKREERTVSNRHPMPDSLDPDNRLLWRQNRRRLDAEQLRDAMLITAGRLDRAQSPSPGPATPDLTAPRRSVYLMAVRSDTSNFRMLFDASDPTSSIHVRNESTVAPQALFMLNHPFALSMANAIADRVRREGPTQEEQRITWLYERLFSRSASPHETEIGLRLLREAPSNEKDDVWLRYCQVLLCANEFSYVD